jgi:hypothetical protein
MKRKFLVLFLPLLISCTHYKVRNELLVELKNNISLERRDDLITISRDTLVKYMGKISDDEFLLVGWQLTTLPAQFDDLDNDGKWDELAFLIDFMPMENTTVLIRRTKEKNLMNFMKRTNIRFAWIIRSGVEYQEADSAYRLKGFMVDSTKKYPQFEGPGWENNLVAFRNYFDERNSIDIFGKVTNDMILDIVGINDSYHEPQFWGMDILKVGNSLGAGAIGIFYKDSLYRVSAIEGASFKIIAEGPVRSILDFDFKELNLNGLKLGLKHRISIVPSEFGYRSDVTFYHPADSLLLVTGIVNLHSKQLYVDSTDNVQIFYTHDKQSMEGEYLGLGIIADRNEYQEWFETPREGEGIIDTYAVKLKPDQNHTASYRFYAGWEVTQPNFKDKKVFEDYLKYEAKRTQNPIIVIPHPKR